MIMKIRWGHPRTFVSASLLHPLGREEVADAITGAWQRCSAEEEDDEDNIRSDGRDPKGLYRQKRQAHIKDKRVIIIIRISENEYHNHARWECVVIQG
jgi:hypothetical protein